jgi:flagellar basal-body rod protein FlgB
MPPTIESVTTAALSAAMDAAVRRQAVVAANVANANSEGYVPLRVSFDTQLAEARAALRENGGLDSAHVAALRGAVEPVAEGAGRATANVHLDMEMAELAQASVRFQTLAQAVSRHLGMLALAAGDGRK